MKKDRKKTAVIFYRELGGIVAVFVETKGEFNGYRKDLLACYSHVGQHSTCAPEYVEKLQEVKPEEYADLQKELEGFGYNLKIKNK